MQNAPASTQRVQVIPRRFAAYALEPTVPAENVEQGLTRNGRSETCCAQTEFRGDQESRNPLRSVRGQAAAHQAVALVVDGQRLRQCRRETEASGR